jgi:signal transduction histidine kinase
MELLARARSWFGGTSSRKLLVDTLIAVVLISLCIPMTNSTDPNTTPSLLFPTATMFGWFLWSLPAIVPLALRRVRPEPAAWMFVALTAIHLIFGPAIIYSDFYALLMLYSVLLYGDHRHAPRFLITAFVACIVTAAVWSVSSNVGSLFSGSDGFRIVWTAWLPTAVSMPTCSSITYISNAANCGTRILQDGGIIVLFIAISVISVSIMAFWQRARRSTIMAMRERNASIVAREAEETRIAALAERARIARDMHDVVAHTLSTIIVQSDGGRYAGAHDIDVAKRTMGTIRHEAERAQHDMRRLFGVFDAQGNAGYTDLESLFDDRLSITRHVTGTAQPDRLCADADAAVFRLVQESLTNTRKHAGEGAKVSIDEIWSDDVLSITVSDDGLGAGSARDGHKPGYGLIGMHERIEALGGSVEAAPGPGGGFIVAATIPLSPAKVAATSSDESMPGVARLVAWIRSLLDKVHSKPLSQGESKDLNWIGRISQWTERHYLLMDILSTIILVVLMNSSTYGDLQLAGPSQQSPNRMATTMMTIITLAPLAFRRRFPESSALVVAVMAMLQLLFLPSVLTINLFALVSVHSAVLYGRNKAWHWVSVALVLDSWLCGIKMMSGWNGYGLLIQMLLPSDGEHTSRILLILSGVIPGGVITLAGFACMALARWSRSRGSNALVLLQREEALREEQERRKVLAANLERNRISAAMQTEVLTTLESVIAQADNGLVMLSAVPEPDSARIAASFTAIGSRGRAALAHMRQLLRVLRETGFSDETHGGIRTDMRLRPAAPLENQLHDVAANQQTTPNSGNNQGAAMAAYR